MEMTNQTSLKDSISNNDALKINSSISKEEKIISQATLLLKKEDKDLDLLAKDSPQIIGQGYYRLAKVFYDKADLVKSEEFFVKALENLKSDADTFVNFKIFGFLIRIYSEGQRESLANEYIKKSESLLKKLVSSFDTLPAEYFYNVGAVSNYQGDFERAIENFQLSYQKSQKENEPELMAKSLFALSKAYYSFTKYQDALNVIEQLNELLAILKKDFLRGSMFYLWGQIHKKLGEYEQSLDCFNKSIKILQGKTCWNLYGYILLEKGIVFKKVGEFQKAQIFFDLALNTIEEKSFRRLTQLIRDEVSDLNDNKVDLFLDRHNRVIHEKMLGTIDFKHRFVLLEILFLLAKNPGKYYDKDQLAREIWKDEYNPLIHDKLIYTSISRLRKLIEPKSGNRTYIIRGKDGYTFNPRIVARFHKEKEVGSFSTIGNVEIAAPV